MATTRLISMHQNQGKTVMECLSDRTGYAKNSVKTEGGELVATYECCAETVDIDFILTKKEYEFSTGRTQSNNVIAYQIRQSFKPNEVSPEDANKIGYELAMKFTKGEHAFIVCTHTDKAHIHNHIIFNSTSLDATKKFHDFFLSQRTVRKISDHLCLEHGLSIVENPQPSKGHYGDWLGDAKPKSQRAELEQSIAFVLSKNPQSVDDFLQRMTKEGYEVKRGKHLAFRKTGQARFIRLRSLHEEYSQENILAKILGENPAKASDKMPVSPVQKPITSVNLVIDIQAKLNEGKGGGYENWAKIFNLKQMAQTLSYLTENDLLQYDVLAEKAEKITTNFDDLHDKIQATESHMKEISTLQKYIIHYHKTKDVFAKYRKGGYAPQYLETHREEIEIHRNAKQHFDNLGLKKLPSVKSLREEYNSLAAEKKSLYGTYRQSQKEMQEIAIAKANIDCLFEKTPDKTKEKNIQKER